MTEEEALALLLSHNPRKILRFSHRYALDVLFQADCKRRNLANSADNFVVWLPQQEFGMEVLLSLCMGAV